jgi:hypothetical protein
MSKRLIWAFLALASLLAVPTLAGASGASSATAHQVDLRGLRDGLWTNSPTGLGSGFPGDKLIVVGTTSGTIGGKPTGQGAFYEKLTFGHSMMKATGRGALLFPNGSISLKERTLKNTSDSYVLTAKVTGGTGTYQNASGKLTISGSAKRFKYDKDVSTNNVTGTLNY